MEIKCQHCDHLGTPASVTPTEKGIELVCSGCGEINLLGEDSKNESPLNPNHLNSSAPNPSPTKVLPTLAEETFRKLIPPSGDGYRCPKCLSFTHPDKTNCSTCGLGLDFDFSSQPAPWEQPPSHKEAEFEQSLLLWKSVENEANEENFKKFIAFTNQEGFFDLEVRKLREFLIENENHPIALNYLRIVSKSIQSKIVVAQAQSQSRVQQSEQKFQKIKQSILIIVALMLIILSFFLAFVIYK